MKIKFAIYGLLGLCSEILFTGIGSLMRGDLKLTGYTYMWMFPIYGLGLMLEPIHNKIRSWPVVLRGCVYTALIFSIEYITGFLLNSILGVCPWDYGNVKTSINGYIRLDFTPLWFLLGLTFEKVHDFMDEMLALYFSVK
jgi:uncharacterized membrane protein